MLADDTPCKRGDSVFGSLGDKTSRVTDGAVDVSDALAGCSLGFGRLAFAASDDLGCDRKTALRAGHCTIRDGALALGAIDEHARG